MLRIICLLALLSGLAGCWLPPHIPDPIPRIPEKSASHDDATRNVCAADISPDTPDSDASDEQRPE